jgi:uncharacterized membrane protein YhaH (DUF805 family)
MSTMDCRCCGTGGKKWWYGIAVMLLISVFFLGMDFMMNGRITWSVWPVAALLFFGVGFTLLNKFGRE